MNRRMLMRRESARRFRLAVGAGFPAMLMLVTMGSQVNAHCEIPCGIYDDKMRIVMLEEDIATIEKSMKQIVALSSETPVNYNQLIRWVMNKDNHAEKIQETVSQYFMTQRIKPVADRNSGEGQKYVRELALLHELLVYSMQAKQTTDMQNVQTMRRLVREFANSYLSEADRKYVEDYHGL
jgi:nickel superoxide dismutase